VSPRPSRLPALLLLLLAGLVSCSADEPAVAPVERPEGHRRMLAVLDEIRRRTPDEHHFLGDRRARELGAQLRARGAAAPWRLWLDAGRAELEYGNEREGIALLETAARGLEDGTIEGDALAFVSVVFYLGVGYMRLAETENCCASPSPDSCILPFRGAGLHARTEGATQAVRCFQKVVDATRDDDYWHHAALWLLNLATMALGEWPEALAEPHRLPPDRLLPDPESPFPRFLNVAGELGLDTFSLSGGVVADDFDGDGDLDLMVSSWDTAGQLRLWRQAEDGRFEDRTGAAGLTGLCGGLNLVQADYDNDGDLDVLVLRGAWLHEKGRHPNSLLRNEGGGSFVDVTFAAGLGEVHHPTQTAGWADYDLDGDLDLYIGNETSDRIRAPGQLFRNEGDGTFVDVAAAAGVENLRYAKAVSWGDFDGDRWPDLYVSNLGAPNRLYRNRGDGTFVDRAAALGVAEPIASFPAWFLDFDDDGVLDLFVSSYDTGVGHLAAWHLGKPAGCGFPRLYRGDGRGGFVDVAGAMGLHQPSMPMGANFGDLDGDGWLDLYLGTGDTSYFSLMPNLMFVNRGGRGFVDVTLEGGFGLLQKGHGIAFADLDDDGDLDVFEQMGGAYRGDGFRDALFENPGFGHRWLVVELVGTRANRSAIGARIRVDLVEDGAARSIHRHVNSGGSFGANPLRQTIPLGRASRIEGLEILWPGLGDPQRVDGVGLDRSIRIVEGEPGFTPRPLRRVRLGGR
jgi:hypothetical protein